MQMSKQKHLSLFLFVLLIAVVLPPLLAVAQDDPPSEPQPAVVTDRTRPVEGQADASQPVTRQDPTKADSTTETAARSLKEFKPTDKIGADSAVSFPVDI